MHTFSEFYIPVLSLDLADFGTRNFSQQSARKTCFGLLITSTITRENRLFKYDSRLSPSLDQEEKDPCDSILKKYANVLPGAGGYDSMDEAAIASMISTYDTNPRSRVEYSSLIYPTDSGLDNFNYTEPKTQNLKNNTDPLIPDEAHSIYHRIENGRLDVPGARELRLLSYELGWSHNHPYDGTEYFSRYDIMVSNDRVMTGYLLTPDLNMIKYQPAEDRRPDPRRGVPIEGAPTAAELELLKDCL